MRANGDKEAAARSWWPETALVAGVVVLTALLGAGYFLDLDVAVRDWSDAHRPPVLETLARALNQMGSANLLAAILVVLAVPLIVRRRSARPLLPIAVTYAVAVVIIVPIKILCDRAAPHSLNADAVRLFADPDGWSYPSGHMANMFFWYPLLVAYLDANLHAMGRGGVPEVPRRVLVVVPPVVVAVTVTYLGFHWVTDSVAGVLLGILVLRLLRRMPWTAVTPAPELTPAGR